MMRNFPGCLLLALACCLYAETTSIADEIDQIVVKRSMLGSWTVKYMEQGGRPTPAKNMRMEFYRHYAKLIKNSRPATEVGYYTDFRNNPGSFSWFTYGHHGMIKQLGIYHLTEDTLTLCVGAVNGPKPSSFQSKYNDGQTLFVLTRSSASPKIQYPGAEPSLTLGVFSLAVEDETEVRSILKLNTDHEGHVKGQLFYLKTNQQVDVQGQIDRVTRQVKVSLGPDSETSLTFDLDDVTAEKIKASVEVKGQPPQTWTMTNLFSKSNTNPVPPGELID
jgi:uncharacterized protein (TIGR03067 family)